jgi:hypothetical protein
LLLYGTLALVRVPFNVFPATMLGMRELVLRQIYEAALVLSLFAGTLAVFLLGGRTHSLIWVTNVAVLILSIASYPLLQRFHPQVRVGRRYWTPSLVKPLLTNSSFFFLYALGFLFQRLMGNVLAGRLGSLAEVPQMFVLLTLFRVVGWSLAEIPSRTIQPYVINLNVAERKDRVAFFAGLATKTTFAFAVVYTAAIWVLADWGLGLWLGPGLFLGYEPLAYLAGSFLIDVLFLSTCNFMRALNRHEGLSVAMAGYAIVTFLLGVAGASWWRPQEPLTGLCAGFFAASLLTQGFVLPWITHGWLQVRWRSYADHFLLRPFLLAAAAVASLVLLGLPAYLSTATRIGCFFCIAVLVLLLEWHLVLDEREREWVTNLKRAWAV